MDAVNTLLLVKAAGGLGLIAGGIVAIVAGYRLFVGKSGAGRDGTVIKYGDLHIRVGTIGAVLALTAAFWGWLATRVLPTTITTNKTETRVSILGETPKGDRVWMASGTGADARYLECTREQRDLVCFNVAPGTSCGPAPSFARGLRRIQATAVPPSANQQDVATNRERELRKFLADRGYKDWALNLMNHYPAPENGVVVRRIAFNNVATELAAPMCTWLACEGWTYGPCVPVYP